MNKFCFSILITSFFKVLVSVCPSFEDSLHEPYSFCTRTKQLGYNETTLIRKMKKRDLWKGFSREQIKENARKRWDNLCEQAVVLRREQRLNYWKISLQLCCDSTMLGKELKKRGLYRKFHKDIKQDDYI
ncbi:hypothetical protein FOS08_29085 [Bacillus pseudomycoides]|uniref:Uncharacterized protein n=2 Tax=Bacillus pseudomycoides TaxID=64104 RepID=A0AAJ2DN10_9BACI|nr:hypothetical protein [Bacillus pseudomycoides]